MKNCDIPVVPGLPRKEFRMGSLLERAESLCRAYWTDIPKLAGIYIVFLPPNVPFNSRYSTGMATHASPTAEADLSRRWREINGRATTDIVYIGKGADVRKRIRLLARFGCGKARNHKGGEWMWQVTGIRSASILIQACPGGKQVPFEKALLDMFFAQHGDWPLANRKGGDGYETWLP